MASYDHARRQRLAINALRWLLATLFVTAGVAKLAGVPAMVEAFEHIGLGQWFRYVTGAIEAGSAVLLLTHRFVAVGALLLVCTMMGAIVAHLTVAPGSLIPAAILLTLSATIAFFYRDQMLGLASAIRPTSEMERN